MSLPSYYCIYSSHVWTKQAGIIGFFGFGQNPHVPELIKIPDGWILNRTDPLIQTCICKFWLRHTLSRFFGIISPI